jgi:hemolysin D
MTVAPVSPSPMLVPAARAALDHDLPSLLAAPPRPRRLLWLLAAVFAFAIVGMAVGKIDVVVSANGRIVASDGNLVVQPIETSVVRTIPVKMGQKVKAGDVVATLDPTFSQADQGELEARLRDLRATYDRLQAELAGQAYDPRDPTDDAVTQRDIFRRREQEYLARLNAAEHKVKQLEADLAAHQIEARGLADQINLAGQADSIYQQLVAVNLASKLRLIETSQHLVDAKARLDTNQGEQKKLVEETAAAQADQDAFIQEWRRKIAEALAQARSDKDATEARLTKARMRHELAVLRAPRDATVLEIADRPPGSVVREAEPLIMLVPADAPLLAEVQIDTRDVAHLQIGDRATVKFEALPWQQFGLAHGILERLTPDTVEDRSPRQAADDMTASDKKAPIHYLARIRLVDDEFHNLPKDFELRPGMRLVADIKIGRRSILQYVLNPITRVFNESLREP